MSLEMKYFVLKPRGHGHHAVAARRALRAYADSIVGHDLELACSLGEWVDLEQSRVEPITPINFLTEELSKCCGDSEELCRTCNMMHSLRSDLLDGVVK